MRKEFTTRLMKKWKTCGKRGVSFALIFAMLIGCVCWDGMERTLAGEETLEMPSFQYFNILPAQIADDATYYQAYNLGNRCSNKVEGKGASSAYRTGSLTSERVYRGTYSVIGNNYTSGRYVSNNPSFKVTIELGTPYEYSVFKDYTQKEQLSMRLAYTKKLRVYEGVTYRTSESAGFFKTDWVSMGAKRISISSESIYQIYDVMLVLADRDMPDNDNFSAGVLNETPVIWMDCGEMIRPANYSITKSNLANLKMKVALVPKLNQSEENTVSAIFVATEIDNSSGKIGFTAMNQAELIETYGSEGDIPENMKSAEELMDEEWRIITIEDDSVEESYPLVTSLGETELTVSSPITDMAGNPVKLAKQQDYTGQTKLYLDAVSPVAKSTIVNGFMDETGDGTEISSASSFVGVGEQIGLSLKLSERVYLADGASLDAVSLTWNVKDKDGNYVTTKLQSIQTSEEVNTERVSILVFESIVIEDGMQGTLTARELIGSESLVDASNNPLDANVESANPEKQLAIDAVGPTVSIGENVVTKRDTNTEKYYIFQINVSDGEGAGLVGVDGQNVVQKIALSSNVDVADLKWQIKVTTSTDAVAFESEANIVTSAKQYEEFEIIPSNNSFVHLYLCADANVEIADDIVFDLDVIATDAKGNQTSTTAKSLTGIGFDGKKPLLVVTPQAVEVSKDETNENVNNVKFAASIVASDLNDMKLYYQWVDDGATATDNNWQEIESGATVKYKSSVDFSLGNSVETEISKVLHVRAIDAAGNITTYQSEEGVFAANVERVNVRYEIVYDDIKAGGIRDIKIYKPVATNGSESGYTRVMVTLGDATYVRIFNSVDFPEAGYYMLFDTTAEEWHEVEIDATGIYSSVSSAKCALPLSDYYGNLTVDFAASALDLTPVANAAVTPSDDTTFEKSISLEMIYTCKRDDVHSITFNNVKDKGGNVLSSSGTSEAGVKYYKFNLDLAGVKCGFTIENKLLESLGVADVDFANSYAILMKADANGNLTEETASDKISLMSAADQSVVVPYKEGGYETGVYALKVYIAQKDGGMQEFVVDTLFLVDNDALPKQFGVTKYDRKVKAAEGINNREVIDISEKAVEGEYLTSVDVGLASQTDAAEIIYVDGKPAFTRTSSNAIGGGKGVTITLRAETNGTSHLGEVLGKVSGVRVWNQASKAGEEEVAWNTGAISKVTLGENYTEATLELVLLESYAEEYNVVDAETLAALDWNEFKVKMGHNVICYQFRMENGRISPVYTFEINLYDEAPEIEVSYAMENSFETKNYIRDNYYDCSIVGTEYLRTYAQSYYFKIDSAYSDAGDITVYHAIYKSETGWKYYEVDDASNPILIEEEEIYGYKGLSGTRPVVESGEYNISNGVREFFIVMDEVGNSYSYYPIINSDPSTADAIRDENNNVIYNEDGWVIGIAEDSEPLMTYFTTNRDIGKLEAEIDKSYTGVSYSISFGEWAPPLSYEKLSVKVDDQQEVVLEELIDEWESVVNQAGIVAYNGWNQIEMVFPYDSTKEDGEEITHTIVLTGYIGDEIAKDADGNQAVQILTIKAPNVKPALVQNDTPEVGAAPVQANTYLFADGITDGYEYEFDLQVYANGTYKKGFFDIFGGYHELEVEITDMPADPTVEISTTEMTANPVEITVKSDGGSFSISPDTELPSVAEVTGIDSSDLKIVMNDNGYFEVLCSYEDGSTKKIIINVNNIHNDPIVPEIQWSYSEYAVDKTDNSYIGEVTATLIDKNGSPLTDLATGLTPSVTFVPGGETSYTFTNYVNIVGVVGADYEVVLPITLKNPEIVVEDTYHPDVAITGYAKFQNETIILNGAFVCEDELRADSSSEGISFLPDYEAVYGADYIYDSVDELLSQAAYVERYIFTLEIGDENDVKAFIVEDKLADVPKYSTGKSDTIEGVSLVGRTLQISKNAEFALHLVDSKNNSTSLYFNVTNIGDEAPKPIVTQTLVKGGEEVRVYLTNPSLDGVTDLTITNADAKLETDENSNFYGMPYVAFTQNYPDGVMVGYSYMYGELKIEGSVIVYITEIDDTMPMVTDWKWSANYGNNKYTNQNITVQLAVSKPVGEVYLVDEQGNRILNPEGVTISFLEDRITVIYEGNAPAICLKMTDAVRKTLSNTFDLPEITTIDKTKAQLSVQTEFSSNHRKLYVTITSEEAVTWPDGTVGTEYKFTTAKNGDFDIRVSDKAGNISTASVSVTDVITENLSILLSTGGSDETVINPETHQIDIGDKLYIKTNRAAVVTLNSNTTGMSVNAGAWAEITIEADAEGLYPTIQAVDEYGNIAMVQLLQIPIKDRTAPSILLNKSQVSASLDASPEELEELLRNNYVASDNETAAEDLIFRYEIPNVQTAGTYTVTYYVEDEAGNVASAKGWIRLYNGEEILVEVNGVRVERDETIIVSAGTQTITVVHNGEPYKVEWRKGLKSLGQMKNNAYVLTEYTEEIEKEMTLELTDEGYYTILVTTQGRDMYRFVIYVEE